MVLSEATVENHWSGHTLEKARKPHSVFGRGSGHGNFDKVQYELRNTDFKASSPQMFKLKAIKPKIDIQIYRGIEVGWTIKNHLQKNIRQIQNVGAFSKTNCLIS